MTSPSRGVRSGLVLRRGTEADLTPILHLAQESLRWRTEDPNEAFFRWKHLENPVGPSPMWVALDEDRIVGLRVFLRWSWQRSDGAVVHAVRAVDTATHPDYQGRGIFTDLTLAAVDELCAEGAAFVFNTPNDQSRPGYLKMGWQVLGRVPLSVRILSPGGARHLLGARAPADKWSALATAGVGAGEAFEDAAALRELLDSQPPARGLSTERTAEFLRWRYGFEPLGYRILLAGSSVSEGFAAYRLRRRGTAIELTACDVVVPGNDSSARRRLIGDLARQAGGDYLVQASAAMFGPGPTVRVPRLGPILTWRPLAEERQPDLGRWQLTLGDVELF